MRSTLLVGTPLREKLKSERSVILENLTKTTGRIRKVNVLNDFPRINCSRTPTDKARIYSFGKVELRTPKQSS
jgi:hypothetical protein